MAQADPSVIQGKVEDIELPVKTVDVIISEWMVSLRLSYSRGIIMLISGIHALVRVDAGLGSGVSLSDNFGCSAMLTLQRPRPIPCSERAYGTVPNPTRHQRYHRRASLAREGGVLEGGVR